MNFHTDPPLTITSPYPGNGLIPKGTPARFFTICMKSYIALGIFLGFVDIHTARVDYCCSIRTLQRYVEKLKSEDEEFHDKGRPLLISKADTKLLHAMVRQDYQIPIHKVRQKVAWMIKGEEVETAEEAKKVCSQKSFKRILDKIGVKVKKAEVTTEARAVAVSDKRHALTFVVMLLLFASYSHPSLMINMDSTQFKVGDTSGGKVEVACPIELENDPKALPEDMDKGGMSFFIKFFLIIAGDGARAPPVYLIADNTMKADQCDWHTSPSSLSELSQDEECHIVFCKSRVPCEAFYTELFNRVLVPFFQKRRKAAEFVDPSTKDIPIFFTLDGEKVQLTIYEKQEIRDMLDLLKVVVGKPPASTTAITQPCDHSSCFKSPKTKLEGIHDRHFADNDHRFGILSVVFRVHFERMMALPPDEVEEEETEEVAAEKLREALLSEDYGTSPEVDASTGKKKMSSSHVTSAKYGLLRIQRALDTALTPKVIMKAFLNCGIQRDTNPNYIFDTLFVKAKITNEDKMLFCKHLKGLKQEMLTNGEISDEYMDRIGFPQSTTSKDDLILPRRRSCILTNLELVAREAAKREAKEQKEKEAADKKAAKATKRAANQSGQSAPKKRGKKEEAPLVGPSSVVTVSATTLKISRVKAVVPPVNQ